MEKMMLVGYQAYHFDDEKGNHYAGYTLFLLEPVRGDGNKGLKPVQFFDRFKNRPKFPTISQEDFKKYGVGNFTINKAVQVLFDRNNKLIEIQQ